MTKPKVCILRSAGTNCDQETGFAFTRVGAQTHFEHINRILEDKSLLDSFHILAIPGGFTYGDDVAAGRIMANEIKCKLMDAVYDFIKKGKLIIGICNGFQILVKSGLLPGNNAHRQESSLITNDSAKFEDRWVYLRTPYARSGTSKAKCVWVKDIPEIIYLPVAHGEGKFIAEDSSVLNRLSSNGQVVFTYVNDKGESCGYPFNPNGSTLDIAGICDQTGRILGLMPHPERHIDYRQHPRWSASGREEADGLKIFKNGVEYAKNNL